MGYGFQKKGGGLTNAGASKLLAFNGQRPITLPGIANFTGKMLGGTTIPEFLEGLFPAVPPSALLSGGSTRLFGASPAVTLNWTASKNTNPIQEIVVHSEQIIPTGNTQSGVLPAMAQANVNTTFSMLVRALSQVITASTTVSWSHYRYWGRIPGLPGGQLPVPTDVQINSPVGGGKEFASARQRNFPGIDGGGNHLYFVVLTSWGTPQFSINSLPNNAFTKVRFNTPFVNENGYTSFVDVWITDTIYQGAVTLTIG